MVTVDKEIKPSFFFFSLALLNMQHTVEPLYYGHPPRDHMKRPDLQGGVLISEVV